MPPQSRSRLRPRRQHRTSARPTALRFACPFLVAASSCATSAFAVTYTAARTIDLTPTNLPKYTFAGGYAITGNLQAGYAGGISSTHATLWSGSASTAVDLNPTNLSGYSYSKIFGANGMQQVGEAAGNSIKDHAMLWSGTANSAIDLHPSNLPNLSAYIYSRAGDEWFQTGWIRQRAIRGSLQ